MLFVHCLSCCSSLVRSDLAYHGWLIFHIIMSNVLSQIICSHSFTTKSLYYSQIINFTMFKIISAFIYCHVYMRKTNKMHLYLINLSQLNFSLHVLNKQVNHQQVIAVQAAYSISHAYMGCPAANTVNRIMLAAGHPTDA